MNKGTRQYCIDQLLRAVYELEKAQSDLITDQHRKEREGTAAVRIRDVLITMDRKTPPSVILMVKVLENLDPESFVLSQEDIKEALWEAKCEFGV